MKKTRNLLLVLLAAMLCLLLLTGCGEKDVTVSVTLANHSGRDISSISITPSTSSDWDTEFVDGTFSDGETLEANLGTYKESEVPSAYNILVYNDENYILYDTSVDELDFAIQDGDYIIFLPPEGEVPIEVEDKYVSVARIFDTADEIPESYKGNKYVRTKRDEITSLISYAVGCMFGRYSLDVDGLVLADQGATVDDYLAKVPDPDHVTFMPDADNVLPITDDEYFDDDIVRYFIDFVRTAYGEETLEQNLAFIAEALGGKGTSREVIRTYFLKDFYKDHCQTYKKRPIYWLFDSGKKNGFKCLVYMHRYQPDLLARIRTDYVHEQQERYRAQIGYANDALVSAERGERVRLDKRIKKLNDQLKETIAYEEKLHHLADQMIKIDLDDGVKVNYAKFQDVLAKIK